MRVYMIYIEGNLSNSKRIGGNLKITQLANSADWKLTSHFYPIA